MTEIFVRKKRFDCHNASGFSPFFIRFSVMASAREDLFEEVCSKDFLNFNFGGRGYQDQLNDSIAKTEVLAGVKVELLTVPVNGESVKIVWVTHNFGFLGGSLGCAEGEKITRAFEYGLGNNLPVCIQCRSGGARMQEGTSSLMQMAKVFFRFY